MNNAAKSFDIRAISLSILYNYFGEQNYFQICIKFLDTLIKLCTNKACMTTHAILFNLS